MSILDPSCHYQFFKFGTGFTARAVPVILIKTRPKIF